MTSVVHLLRGDPARALESAERSLEMLQEQRFSLYVTLSRISRGATTGGKPRLLHISKRGNGYLRMLLIHGARTALPGLAKKDTPLGRWVKALLARAHRNVVTVALANKLARIAWAVLARDRQYVTVQAIGK